MKIFAGPSSTSVPRQKPPIRFKMEKSANQSADIFIYDVIGDSWDGTTAKQFAADLRALGSIKTLNIYINSPGGSVDDGTAIYSNLRRHAARKIVHIDGLAASMASLVAMAGDEIRMANNALMMIHRPWGIAIGNEEDLIKAAGVLKKTGDMMVGTYAERSGASEADVAEMMADETWFTAQEAVDAGFADAISEDVQIAALAQYDVTALTKFKNVPETLRKAFAEKPANDTQLPLEAAAVSTATVTVTEVPAPHPAYMRAAVSMRRSPVK